MEGKFFKELGNQRASLGCQPTLEAGGSLIHKGDNVCCKFPSGMLGRWKERLVSAALVRYPLFVSLPD